MIPRRESQRQITGLRLLRENCTRDYQVALLKVKTLYKRLGSERYDIQNLLASPRSGNFKLVAFIERDGILSKSPFVTVILRSQDMIFWTRSAWHSLFSVGYNRDRYLLKIKLLKLLIRDNGLAPSWPGCLRLEATTVVRSYMAWGNPPTSAWMKIRSMPSLRSYDSVSIV
jgi:hypothetical protein